jgi:hypothetical protein
MSFQFDPTFLLTTAGGGLGLAESGRAAYGLLTELLGWLGGCLLGWVMLVL